MDPETSITQTVENKAPVEPGFVPSSLHAGTMAPGRVMATRTMDRGAVASEDPAGAGGSTGVWKQMVLTPALEGSRVKNGVTRAQQGLKP